MAVDPSRAGATAVIEQGKGADSSSQDQFISGSARIFAKKSSSSSTTGFGAEGGGEGTGDGRFDGGGNDGNRSCRLAAGDSSMGALLFLGADACRDGGERRGPSSGVFLLRADTEFLEANLRNRGLW
ncbi:hypothetical protein TRIUR3_29818 [Triticum urartu]|uniref:Uncharacterized protein n=1 Tax=Triticum urartu TaxID=4572 RepID=M7XL05_TRIUA|nr:hypothetical protein TRIUR3_29818 [Triticum urartu]